MRKLWEKKLFLEAADNHDEKLRQVYELIIYLTQDLQVKHKQQ